MNRLTQLFKIEYPIIQAGMVWCSGYKLASAVSNAGGLGLLGAGSMGPELLREHIQKCRLATNRPFGVNVPIMYAKADEIIQVIIEEKVSIVFTSAGNPAKYTGLLKDRGIIVVHVVPGVKFALKAQSAGVDAVVAEGFEAGGHNGRDETTTLCLIPAVKDQIKIPLIAAGGIADGRGMLSVIALGAEGVQIGSRFVASVESSAHQHFKELLLHLNEGDTMLALKKLAPVRLIKNKFFQAVQTAEANGASPEELLVLLSKGRAKRGMFDGDLEDGELEIGQISVLIHDILPAAEILARIWNEFQLARTQLANWSTNE